MAMHLRRHIGWILLVLFLTLTAIAAWWVFTRWDALSRRIRGKRFPTGIVIHHTATPPSVNGKLVDVACIDAMHARRGFAVTDCDGVTYHIGYHFLIQQDGTVLRGRPEHLRGAHAKGYPQMLGIALIGNFHRSSNRGRCGPLTPPPAQLAAVASLTCDLMRKHQLSAADVYLHRDLCPTACPGDSFPRAAFYRTIENISEGKGGRGAK